MNFKVVLDWKLIIALGGVAVSLIFAAKLDPTAIQEVSIHAIDTLQYALIKNQ